MVGIIIVIPVLQTRELRCKDYVLRARTHVQTLSPEFKSLSLPSTAPVNPASRAGRCWMGS